MAGKCFNTYCRRNSLSFSYPQRQQVAEASRFMQFGKRKGYGTYPVLALALLLAPAAVRAQSTADQQQTPQTTETQPPAQTQSQAPPSQRAEVLRQAQQRVNARRRLRVEQI